jgi:hypothetical protein
VLSRDTYAAVVGCHFLASICKPLSVHKARPAPHRGLKMRSGSPASPRTSPKAPSTLLVGTRFHSPARRKRLTGGWGRASFVWRKTYGFSTQPAAMLPSEEQASGRNLVTPKSIGIELKQCRGWEIRRGVCGVEHSEKRR